MADPVKTQTILIDSQYLPCIDYYIALLSHDKLKIEQYEHYQKVSYRNRCYVAGPDGRILLSVPLEKGKNQRTLMKDVRICNDGRWQSLQWKTLTSAYRRSPWFEYYEDDLRPWFEKKFEFLLDWNLAVFEQVNHLLGLEIRYELTTSYEPSYPEDRVADKRSVILPGGLKNASPENYPVYTQVFGERTGFLPNLSILDLLFCEGRRAVSYLKKIPG